MEIHILEIRGAGFGLEAKEAVVEGLQEVLEAWLVMMKRCGNGRGL